MIPDDTWLDADWFDDESYQIYDNLKGMLIGRGFKFYERRNIRVPTICTQSGLGIWLFRNHEIADRIHMLIHEFCHFELGHRESKHVELMAEQEIDCCLVTHVVCMSLGMYRPRFEYIYEFPARVAFYRDRAIRIAVQIGEYWT